MKRDKAEIGRDVLSLVCAFVVVALACALSYVFTSCTQEPPLPYDGGQKEYMDFSLELTPPGAFTPAATRGVLSSPEQNAVNRAAVLVFKDDVLLSHQIGTVTDVDGIKKQVQVRLKTSQSESDLYDLMVIGNPPAGFDFSSYVSKTKAELKAAFNVSVSGKWSGSEFVMYGEVLQTLIKPTTNSFKIEMLRSLARVDIGVGVYNAASDTWAGLPGVFTLREVRVVNSRDKFAVIPAATALNESGNVKVTAPTIPAGTGVQGTRAASAITYSGLPDITDNSTQSAIFLAEAPNTTNRVTLLVGGSYQGGATTYYRIDMCVSKAGVSGSYDYLPILRNHLYRISITGVGGEGFADPQEALNSAPNITTDLTVIAEEGMGDIVFDAHSYIQTDVSSVQIYGVPDGTKSYAIATVKANFVAGVAATVTGLGITSTIHLTSDVATPIAVAIPAGATIGSYTIKVGRLSKVIPVSIQAPVDAHFDFLPFERVSRISIEKPQSWLTLSHSTTYVKSEQQASYIVGNSAGKACFHFDENSAIIDTLRMARALVQRNDNSGVTRVCFEQCNFMDMVLGYYGGPIDNFGYTLMLIAEMVEEYSQRVYDDTSIGTTRLGISWGFHDTATNIIDVVSGQSRTIELVKRTDSGITAPYTIYNNYAARYCYDKNRDLNGNGKIDDAEVIWYLPAQNQLMGAWIARSGMKTQFTPNNYWSVTEDSSSSFSRYVTQHTGGTYFDNKIGNLKVRCVRDFEKWS